MRTLTSKPGFAALTIGVVVLLHLAVFGLLFSADLETVSFQGHVLPETCSWKTVLGVPCPTCGMTRGIVLAMHGQWAASYAVNRSALVLVASALLVGFGLASAGVLRLREQHRASDELGYWTQRIGLAGGGLWVAMLAVNWTLVLRSLHGG
jgi:hypothetical protein